MIYIAVCDDDLKIVQQIEQYLLEKGKALPEVEMDISLFQSGVDFLRQVENGAKFHVAFMDIQMAGISGIDVGRALREKPDGDDVIMIYISNHDYYFEELVRIGSFRFIGKPIDMDELDDIFNRAFNQVLRYNHEVKILHIFRFKSGPDEHLLKTRDIVFLKNSNRVKVLFAWDSVEEKIYPKHKFYSTMDAMRSQLPQGQFVHCERSHILNLDYVQKLEKDFFVLKDKKKTRIPIGRAFRAESRKAYFRYQEDLT